MPNWWQHPRVVEISETFGMSTGAVVRLLLWVMRANGATWKDIHREIGIDPAKARRVDRKIQDRLAASFRRQIAAHQPLRPELLARWNTTAERERLVLDELGAGF